MTLTLAECLERAVRLNPLVLAKESDIKATEAKRDAAWGNRWASAKAHAFAGPVPEARGDAINYVETDVPTLLKNLGPFFRFQLQLIQPLWTFGKLSNARDGLQELVEVEGAKREELKWQVITQVKILYNTWVFLDELTKLMDEIQERIDHGREKLEEHLANEEEGVTPKDRLLLKLFQAELDARRIDVRARREIVQGGLTRLLMLDNGAQWRPSDNELNAVEVKPKTLQELTHMALADHPEMAQIRHGLAALEAQHAYHKSNYYPNLFLAGRLGYAVAPNRDDQKSPFASDNFNFFELGVALGLQYELGLAVKHHEVRVAHAQLASLEAKRDGLVRQVEQRVQTAFSRYKSERDKMGVTKRAFRTARAWVTSAMNGLDMGTGNVKDAVDSFKEYIKVRFGFLEAVYNQNVAAARLSEASGLELQIGLTP